MIPLLVSLDAERILIYIFIGIFVITAFLTLASLPGWIKLEEWYRKKLFLTLIVEVVGIIVIAGRGIFITPNDRFELPKEADWIALYADGNVKQPKITVGDSTYLLGSKQLRDTAALKMTFDIEPSSKLNLLVKSGNDVVLGKVGSEALNETGLFNLLADINSHNHYANIRWEKTDGKWKRVDKTINKTLYSEFIDEEVVFEVFDSPEGTKYRLYNDTDTLVTSKTREIDARYRIIHFCKNSKNDYYLFRITSANLQEAPEFVNILQIKLSPQLNLGRK